MSRLGQSILNATHGGEKVGINGRLKFCHVTKPKIIVMKLQEFLPFSVVTIDEESETEVIVSIDMHEVKLRYKFSLNVSDIGYYISNIEEI